MSADQKTMFTYAKPPLTEIEKDLNRHIAICIIFSVSANEDQTSLAFIENFASLAENSPPAVTKSASFA